MSRTRNAESAYQVAIKRLSQKLHWGDYSIIASELNYSNAHVSNIFSGKYKSKTYPEVIEVALRIINKRAPMEKDLLRKCASI